MPKITNTLKKLLFTTILAITFLFSKDSKGQCIVSDINAPNCIQQGISVTFENNTDETNVITDSGAR